MIPCHAALFVSTRKISVIMARCYLSLVDSYNQISGCQPMRSHTTNPKLLQLTFWYECPHQKDIKVTLQAGSRAPLIFKDYRPEHRLYYYDICPSPPTLTATLNSQPTTFPLHLYSEHQEHSIGAGSQPASNLHFKYKMMEKSAPLEQKYQTIKDNYDKHARGQGLNNLIRAQSQFLSVYERDQEIEQLKNMQLEQEQIQTRISEEIVTLQKSAVDWRMLVVLVVLFIVVGYLTDTVQQSTGVYVFGSRPEKATKRPKKKARRR